MPESAQNGHRAARAVQEAVEDALKAPAADPVPHPALDVEPDLREADKGGLDKIVFGVSAAVAVAFLAWGMISTAR